MGDSDDRKLRTKGSESRKSLLFVVVLREARFAVLGELGAQLLTMGRALIALVRAMKLICSAGAVMLRHGD